MILVEKAKTERIKDHKIISLTLKQGSEMNNLFIISISFFPGISQTNSLTNSPSLASLIVSGSVKFHRLISAVNLFRSFYFGSLLFSWLFFLLQTLSSFFCVLWLANILGKGKIYSSKSGR